jgi:hypothetical protein
VRHVPVALKEMLPIQDFLKIKNLALGKVSIDPLETLCAAQRAQFENHCFR